MLDKDGLVCLIWDQHMVFQFETEDTSDKPHLESSPCMNGKDMGQKQTKVNKPRNGTKNMSVIPPETQPKTRHVIKKIGK